MIEYIVPYIISIILAIFILCVVSYSDDFGEILITALLWPFFSIICLTKAFWRILVRAIRS